MSLHDVIAAMRKRAHRKAGKPVTIKSGEQTVQVLLVKVQPVGRAAYIRESWKVNGKRVAAYHAFQALREAAKDEALPGRILCNHKTWLGHAGTGRVFCADCGLPREQYYD